MPLITQDENNAVATRLQSFKNMGKNVDEMRRRRNEVNVELRKARKDDQLLKRRNISVDDAGSPLQENNGQTNAPIMSIQQIMEGMDSSDETKQLTATQAARKTLSRERNPPIDAMIESGIVPKCVGFLTYYQNPSLQFEASWALTNIASGTTEQTNAVVQQGAVPKFINLLASPYMHVAEQAVWALGNIAGDGPVARDLVLSLDALPALIGLIKPDTNESLMRNIVWTLSNLCRNKNPPPPFDCIKPCLPVLNKLLYCQDKDVLADACWALSYVTDGSNDKIQAVVDNGVVPRLVELLGMEEVGVLTPALRAVGNIVTGNDLLIVKVMPSQICILLEGVHIIRERSVVRVHKLLDVGEQLEGLNKEFAQQISNHKSCAHNSEYLEGPQLHCRGLWSHFAGHRFVFIMSLTSDEYKSSIHKWFYSETTSSKYYKIT